MKRKLLFILLTVILATPLQVFADTTDIDDIVQDNWGAFEFLVLIGSLGVFIFGMKLMSDGLQKVAGTRLRHLLGSMTSSPFKGVLTGFGITTMTQSSTVTTVMTVSFVNAGLLTLAQAAGVIMGANIGTTVTGWIINIFGFQVDIASYALVLIGIAVPLMFVSKQKIKSFSNILIGFALLFMGLGFLKEAVPVISADSGFVNFFIYFSDIPVIGTIVFVLFGTILTIVVQSSSAALALTMTLILGGVIPFEVGAAMILGENIGTCITAELAATVGNVHAKRAARIHTAFNVIGVTWVVILFPFILRGIEMFMLSIGSGSPFEDPVTYANTGIVILHSFFNITNTLVLIWFTPHLVRLAERTVKSKGEEDEEFHFDFIGIEHMPAPSISLLEAKKGISKYSEITYRMFGLVKELFHENNSKAHGKMVTRIGKYEEITDKIEVELANYLNKISATAPEKEIAIRIRGMNSIIINMERIGDIFYQIAKGLEQIKEEGLEFTEIQKQRLEELFDILEEAFLEMQSNLDKHSASVSLAKAEDIENRINAKRDEMLSEYLDSFSENEKQMRAGIIYNSIFASMGRIGGHVINVTEGIIGKI